jgi:hypothetical protein
MKGDFSRSTFKPAKHYSSVRMQQGRVQMDADWNEQADIFAYLNEHAARDIIGPSGAPEAHAGFAIAATPDGSDLIISTGRYYVDGILCESEYQTPYSAQPDFPKPQPVASILAQANAAVGLVYLDVWKRHLTAIDDPSIREVALGGPDTSSRVKTVWQVKVLPIVHPSLGYGYGGAEDEADEPFGCTIADSDWQLLSNEPQRVLNARIQPVPPSSNACEVIPTGGYQRLENQLYRVEVHQSGDLGQATFKWSRENGSVVTSWLGQDVNNLQVASIGRDATLGFAANNWVELTDDSRELLGIPGQLVQVVSVQGDVLTINPPMGVPVDRTQYPLNPKIRRWDQSGGELSVTVPAGNNGYLALEGGIEVLFAGSGFQTGDYWLIPARTAMAGTEIGGIDWPTNVALPPAGVHHSRSRLAIVNMDANRKLQVSCDCRHVFLPLTSLAFSGHGFHIQDIRFLSDYPMRNGCLATAAELANGFRVYCNAPLMVDTLHSSVVCAVTVYIPFFVPNVAGAAGLNNLAVGQVLAGYQPILIAATVDVVAGQPNVFQLTVGPATGRWLTTLVAGAPNTSVPARLTIKGSYILSANGNRGALDANGDGLPGGQLDFFFSVLQTRPAYNYTPGRLVDLQPQVFTGIGSHLV